MNVLATNLVIDSNFDPNAHGHRRTPTNNQARRCPTFPLDVDVDGHW